MPEQLTLQVQNQKRIKFTNLFHLGALILCFLLSIPLQYSLGALYKVMCKLLCIIMLKLKPPDQHKA